MRSKPKLHVAICLDKCLDQSLPNRDHGPTLPTPLPFRHTNVCPHEGNSTKMIRWAHHLVIPSFCSRIILRRSEDQAHDENDKHELNAGIDKVDLADDSLKRER